MIFYILADKKAKKIGKKSFAINLNAYSPSTVDQATIVTKIESSIDIKVINSEMKLLKGTLNKGVSL